MNAEDELRLDAIVREVYGEVERAVRKHPTSFNSAHEGYAVIKEEVDEMWDEVKRDNHSDAITEALQVAAMGIRFVFDMRKKYQT